MVNKKKEVEVLEDLKGNTGKDNTGENNSGDFNSGDRNSGHWNSGHWNSGDFNSGDRNSGDFNSGDFNSGDFNSGDRNSGDFNSGDRNSGDRNSGHWNSGHWNSGDFNSGDRNSGDFNSGDRNSGHWNSGHWNSGDWNSGHWNSGFLNTTEPKVRIFNEETDIKREKIDFPDYFYFKLTKWIDFEDMTEEEKEKHPFAEHTEGYLKTYDYKEAWKKSFEKANKEDVAKTLELPNFNYKIFEEITGITKEMIDKKLGKSKDTDSKPKSIIIDGVEYIRKQEVGNE